MEQHQGSLNEQLLELLKLANMNGLYDAADWLVRQIPQNERSHKG